MLVMFFGLNLVVMVMVMVMAVVIVMASCQWHICQSEGRTHCGSRYD